MSYSLSCCPPRSARLAGPRRLRGLGLRYTGIWGKYPPPPVIVGGIYQGGISQSPTTFFAPVIIGRRYWNWPPPVATPAQPSTPANPTGAPSTILKWDAYGNPIYSVPPPGQVVTGYDAAGNPIWGAPSGATPTSAIVPAATPSVSVTTPAATSGYQSVLDWFSESTLITGLPNWGIALGALVLLKMVGGKKGGIF